MLCKSTSVTLPLLVASVLLLTGCAPAPDLTQWKRPNTDIDGVRIAMGKCGVPLPGPDIPKTDNESVLYYQCMESMGFTRKDGFKICSVRVYHDTPACIKQEQGYSLSQRQLEALPFVADRGFHPIKPDSGVSQFSLISWRKAGASRHFSHEIENDKQALAAMYQCGYPQPLGSVPYVPTLRKAADAQRCMLDKDFEPKNKLSLVCRNYPQVTGCQ
ncbi:hypothetical protein [Pectobacterium peruviense]|uniref:Lipoprotein n=1 Tax=Pectobacterium peruviense TaxID=2066479 RepID=A0ABX4SBL3_9GAMM|nr:hypothetical protein [Pectobacterium peruviense]KML67276.1 hypothetical protein G033_11195 [Pectobacterium peruviense]PKX87914.1 hypothetical protein A0G03_01515 [Pectobacterium peruviense]